MTITLGAVIDNAAPLLLTSVEVFPELEADDADVPLVPLLELEPALPAMAASATPVLLAIKPVIDEALALAEGVAMKTVSMTWKLDQLTDRTDGGNTHVHDTGFKDHVRPQDLRRLATEGSVVARRVECDRDGFPALHAQAVERARSRPDG